MKTTTDTQFGITIPGYASQLATALRQDTVVPTDVDAYARSLDRAFAEAEDVDDPQFSRA